MKAPIVLVGNKIDLTSERVVRTEEGKKLATEWKCKFVETSAKTGVNVPLVMEELVRELEKSSPHKQERDSWCMFL